MPQPIDRDGVRRLAEQGAQLVEVLPAREYGEDHLPGAISLPLRKLEQQGMEVLDRDRGVVVYCWDSECDLSARAKELEADESLRIEQAMRPGPSTFRPHVPIAEMAEFMTDHGLESSPVTTSDGRLVGLLLRRDAIRVAEVLAGL
jgi:CBS domain-containing protein